MRQLDLIERMAGRGSWEIDLATDRRYDWRDHGVTPSFERLLGYTVDEALGLRPVDIVRPDDVPHVMETLAQHVVDPSAPTKLHYRIRHKDGRWRVFENHSRSLSPDTIDDGLIVNCRDITERVEAEEALRPIPLGRLTHRTMKTLRPLGYCLATVTALGCATELPYDVVLANGRVMDPASGLDSVLHVGIRGDSVAALSATALAGRDVVDAKGLVVAPGFIDLHAHGQSRGDMEIQAEDGVTTALDMEAGAFPVAKWYASMEGKAPLNFGATVGHRPARFYVFHDSLEVLHGSTNPAPLVALGVMPAGANASANEGQLLALEGAIRRGLSEGGLGVGFGINYSPGATTAEIERLFRVAASRRATAFVHTRAFGVGAIREAIGAARAAGASLHIVHIASSSLNDLPQALLLVDSARSAGMDVTTEVYPYTAGSTRLESAMFNPGWQKNLPVDYADIAWPLTGERLTKASFDRYRKQGGWVVIHMMREENVVRAIRHPGVLIASDGVPYVNGTGHPRGAGTYARVLSRYVRDTSGLPLMDALARMTILPARRLETFVPAMKRKGRVAVGADADLTVFDPAAVKDRSTFEQPALTSVGIVHVLVNGVFVVKADTLVRGVLPGRAVRSSVVP